MSLSNTIDFGKYAGKTFLEVASTDVSYARWLMKQPSIHQDIKDALESYIPEDQGYIVTFGKYKGKPLEWIKANDQKYTDWLRKAEFIKQNMPKLSKLLNQ